MKKEDLKKLLKKLKEIGAIDNYKGMSNGIVRLSINYDYYYIGFDREGNLKEDNDMIESQADILEKEQELEDLKKQYESEYGEDLFFSII